MEGLCKQMLSIRSPFAIIKKTTKKNIRVSKASLKGRLTLGEAESPLRLLSFQASKNISLEVQKEDRGARGTEQLVDATEWPECLKSDS